MSEDQKNLERLKFFKIGTYELINDKVVCNYSVKKSERLSIVYALLVEDNIKYFGKSIQGYRRPLSYHKNNVMKTVQNGIMETCGDNSIVEVYARKDDLTLEIDNLQINIIEALEQALIKKFEPDWNNHIQK